MGGQFFALQGIPKALFVSTQPPQQERTCQPCGDETSRSLWRCAVVARWSPRLPRCPCSPPASPQPALLLLPGQPPPKPFTFPTTVSQEAGKIATKGPKWGPGEMGSLGARSLPWEIAPIPLVLCSQTHRILRMGTVSSKTPWALTSSREMCTFACERNE